MNTTRWRLLDHVSLAQGDAMDLSTAFDLNNVTTLDIVVSVHSAGAGDSPVLKLQHAIEAEDADGYLDFVTPVAVDLTVAASHWFRLDAFTGYLAWSLGGTLNSAATVSIDLIARG